MTKKSSGWKMKEIHPPSSAPKSTVHVVAYCYLCKLPHPWARPCRQMYEAGLVE